SSVARQSKIGVLLRSAAAPENGCVIMPPPIKAAANASGTARIPTMIRSCKIVHITDLHLGAEADSVVAGWYADRAWQRVIADACSRHPDADLCILGGDLLDRAGAAAYARLNRQL